LIKERYNADNNPGRTEGRKDWGKMKKGGGGLTITSEQLPTPPNRVITLDLCLISFTEELHLVHESSTASDIFSYLQKSAWILYTEPTFSFLDLPSQVSHHNPGNGKAGRVIPYGSRPAHCSWQKLAMIA